jgi:hypothetical protein
MYSLGLPVERERLSRALAPSGSELRATARVPTERDDRGRQGAHVLGGDEYPSARIDDLGQPADVGRNHRQADDHRLEGSEPEWLRA